jgi:hypothetical protein
MIEGHPIKSSAEPFDIVYYKWYNWKNEDIMITLNVRKGLADVYVSTIDENKSSENLVQKLPNSKRNT